MIKILILFTVLLSFNAFSGEKFYYAEKVRNLKINNEETLLMAFPSPPLSRNCHPSNVVKMFSIDSFSETQALHIPQAAQFMDQSQLESALSQEEQVAKLLKIRPLKKNGVTRCAITLVNGDTVSVRFVLTPSIQLPFIEFVNSYTKIDSMPDTQTIKSARVIFKQLVRGGEYRDLIQITPQSYAHNTKTARYDLEFLGENRNFRGFRIKTNFKRSLKNIPELKKVKINELFISTWLIPYSSKQLKQIKQGDKLFLFILARADMSFEEIKRMLP